MPKSIIVIHGVGQSVLANIGNDLAKNLGLSISTEKIIAVNGEKYIEFEDEKSSDSIIEVNWADVLRPKNTFLGVLHHFWLLLTCMLDISVRPNEEGKALKVTSLYRWALFTFSPGSSLFLLSTAVATCICDGYVRNFVFLLLACALGFVSFWTRDQGNHFKWLWPWVAAIVLLGIYTIKAPLDNYKHLIEFALFLRGVGFLMVILLLPLSILEAWFEISDITVRLAHSALRFMPFIAMNGFFTWITFLGLGFISKLDSVQGYEIWESNILPHFDFGQMEFVTTCVVFGIAILGLVIPFVFFKITSDKINNPVPINGKGRAAQDGFVKFLIIAPILMLFLGIYSAWIFSSTNSSEDGILEVYRISVLRTLPYLLWFLGPSAVVMDMVGDILFYLQPLKTHPAYIAKKCKNRLYNAISYARQKTTRDIIVLAHSQGSVIAVDLFKEKDIHEKLITIGSPIDSLYKRFLGVSKGPNSSNYLNLFRDGDVLGGPIDQFKNYNIGAGGHTDYWSDDTLNKFLSFKRPTSKQDPII